MKRRLTQMTRMQHEHITGIGSRWRCDRRRHAAKRFCHSSRLGDRTGTAGRRWQSFWTPPVSGRRVAAAGIPTSSAGCGQDGCVGSCACCCRVSRGIFVATTCRDSRAVRVRRRCFTKRAHGTTWALSAAAAKTTLGLVKFAQGALSEVGDAKPEREFLVNFFLIPPS